jgi:hypothetical protein
LFAAAVLVALNVVALSGVSHLSGSAIGGINAAVAAVLAFLVGLVSSLQLAYVRRGYIAAAREDPASVVPTAGRWIDDVVGRDDLCAALIDGVRNPGTRRSQVLIGREDAGKTAVLVRLTKLLATGGKVPLRVRVWDALRGRGLGDSSAGMIPVPVSLREAQVNLDFSELARARFLASTDAAVLSTADGERIWRQLRQDDKIVVLADGLEEVLLGRDSWNSRDEQIVLALQRANAQRLPLIIASRPHGPLRSIEAVIVELDQLSEEAVLEYVHRADPGEDEYRLEWIVQTASIADNPFYMHIARQLNNAGLIQRPSAHRGDWRGERQLDTRGADRTQLQLRLLQTWEDALVRGYFPPGVALSREDREMAVELLSLLACIGLRHDRLAVGLEEIEDREIFSEGELAPILEEMHRRLVMVGRSFDARLAATWGRQLQIVEAQADAVRFSHGTLQAYLGSRLIGFAMADPAFQDDALRNAGRELLIALVMHSRAETGTGRLRAELDLRTLLLRAARERRDPKALDLYATALEIDSVHIAPEHQAIATEIAENWHRLVERSPRVMEEAKLDLVRRFGEAARTVAQRRRTITRTSPRTTSTRDASREPGNGVEGSTLPGYRQLFKIGCREPSYPVRLAVAQEIGAGGDTAVAELVEILQPARLGEATTMPGAASMGGRGRRTSGNDLEQYEAERRDIMGAWLISLLAGSATEPRMLELSADLLRQWLDLVSRQNQWPDRKHGAGLRLEIALA